MIAERAKEYEVQSTLTGQRTDMSFDENSLVHIMSILTDLYSDPELAIIREYATNAYDSHIEAGEGRPIEVTLPTALAPFFKVRDYGVGLSAEEIHTIYSKYGASTKRETNEQTGMLGLGCKSALTYIDQFTLIAIKDNIRSTVNIGRNENGSGSLTVVESTPTIETPGVEIIIPVSNKYSEFETKARGFFKFWPSGVLINGQVPERISQFKVTDSLYLNPPNLGDFGGRQSIVVMGNVPYPVNHHIASDCAVIAYVPVGAVNFTPSRESLQYTKKTNETLSKLGSEFNQNISWAIQDAIDQANSKSEALDVFIKWKNKVPGSFWNKVAFSYEGAPIIRSISTADRSLWFTRVNDRYINKQRTIDVSQIPGSIVVTGYYPQTFTTIHRSKLKRWADENGIQPKAFLLCKEDIDLEWIDPAYVVDWSFVRSIKLSTRQPNKTTTSLSYDGFKDGAYRYDILADDINTKNLYHCVGPRADTKRYYSSINPLVEGDITLITLPSTRVDKYQRLFPTSKDVESEIKALWDQWTASLSDQVKYAIQVQSFGNNYYFTNAELDPLEIHDPELKAFLEAHNLNIKDILAKYRKFVQVGHCFTRHMTDFSKRYPMIKGGYMHNNPTHPYIYINAVYEKEQKCCIL
jgi:hypothetical protein